MLQDSKWLCILTTTFIQILSGKTKIDHTVNSFLFFMFLGKVHIAYINRHKIGNIHGAQISVARISNVLNKELKHFYFGKKRKKEKEMEKAAINSVFYHERVY